MHKKLHLQSSLEGKSQQEVYEQGWQPHEEYHAYPVVNCVGGYGAIRVPKADLKGVFHCILAGLIHHPLPSALLLLGHGQVEDGHLRRPKKSVEGALNVQRDGQGKHRYVPVRQLAFVERHQEERINGDVDGDHLRLKLPIAEHGANDALGGSHHHSCRPVQIVHPARSRLLNGGCH